MSGYTVQGTGTARNGAGRSKSVLDKLSQIAGSKGRVVQAMTGKGRPFVAQHPTTIGGHHALVVEIREEYEQHGSGPWEELAFWMYQEYGIRPRGETDLPIHIDSIIKRAS